MESKSRGQIMALVGLFMIAVNAITYLVVDNSQFIVGVIGLLFLVIGINISKKRYK